MLTHKEYKQRTRATPQAHIRAQQLRKELTEPEVIVWSLLKSNKLDGHAFRTQHPLGHYIVDFYCHKARLVIEIDGKCHEGARLKHDKQRDAWMHSCGIEVLRVRAIDVFQNLEGVRRTIADRVRKQIALIQERDPLKVPSPPRGEGGTPQA